jgi:putative ABC transport system ATP-binding protein
MIELDDVHFGYGGDGFELHVPSLRIERGASVAVVGPSGSGKTTLLHLIAGIRIPRSGRLVVDGEELSGRGDAGRRRFRISRIGFVLQEFELLEYLTARENILLPYRINRSLRLTPEVRQRAAGLAESAGLDGGKLDRYPHTLSQGEKQRVAICRALVTEPRVILADEPTSNLDPDNAAATMRSMFSLVRRRGATLVMLTHDESLLEGFDRVIRVTDFLAGQARSPVGEGLEQ